MLKLQLKNGIIDIEGGEGSPFLFPPGSFISPRPNLCLPSSPDVRRLGMTSGVHGWLADGPHGACYPPGVDALATYAKAHRWRLDGAWCDDFASRTNRQLGPRFVTSLRVSIEFALPGELVDDLRNRQFSLVRKVLNPDNSRIYSKWVMVDSTKISKRNFSHVLSFLKNEECPAGLVFAYKTLHFDTKTRNFFPDDVVFFVWVASNENGKLSVVKFTNWLPDEIEESVPGEINPIPFYQHFPNFGEE